MGYRSRIEGRIDFSRPLNRKEAAALEVPLADSWNVYALEGETETRETDEGMLSITRTAGLIPLYEDEVKAYEWMRVLQEIVTALPADVQCAGYFEREGEGAGDGPDLERLYVRDREVVSIKPQVVWPEMG